MALKIAPTQTIRRNAVEKAIRERLPFLASGNLVACSIVLIPSPRYSLPPLEVFRKSRARFFFSISVRERALRRRFPLACQLLRLGDLVWRHLRFKFAPSPSR